MRHCDTATAATSGDAARAARPLASTVVVTRPRWLSVRVPRADPLGSDRASAAPTCWASRTWADRSPAAVASEDVPWASDTMTGTLPVAGGLGDRPGGTLAAPGADRRRSAPPGRGRAPRPRGGGQPDQQAPPQHQDRARARPSPGSADGWRRPAGRGTRQTACSRSRCIVGPSRLPVVGRRASILLRRIRVGRVVPHAEPGGRITERICSAMLTSSSIRASSRSSRWSMWAASWSERPARRSGRPGSGRPRVSWRTTSVESAAMSAPSSAGGRALGRAA